MNAEKLESVFNEMVDDAVHDYKTFWANIFYDNEDLFKISTLTNFKELFDICIDIKKREAVEVAKKQTEEAAAQARAKKEAEEAAALAAVAGQIEKSSSSSMNPPNAAALHQTVNGQSEKLIETVDLAGVFFGESSGIQQKSTATGKATGNEKPAKMQRRK